MKSNLKKVVNKNWALPGGVLSIQEFEKGIKDAEKGPFYTIEESKKMIAQWRREKSSK